MTIPNTFKEDKEAFWAVFKTRHGWISFILGNLIWGYLILKYIHVIENFILEKISSLPSFLISPILWILLGIISSVIGYIILLIIERFVMLTRIKNKQIF